MEKLAQGNRESTMALWSGNPDTDRGNAESGALILMRDVVKTFETPVGDFCALKGIDADFHKGEFVGVIGKSGSGKSTLVNMITGIDRPTAGEVRIGGMNVHHLGESDRARWRGGNLGIVVCCHEPTVNLGLCSCWIWSD